MLRKLTVLFLFIGLLFVAAGCSSAQESAPQEAPASSALESRAAAANRDPADSAQGESKSIQETLDTATDENPDDVSQVPASAEAASSPNPAGNIPDEQSSEQSGNAVGSVSAEGGAPTAQDASEPMQPPQNESAPAPVESESAQTGQAPPSEPITDESEPDFDVEDWVSYAKSYAESVGLTLDSEAVWCWDVPIVAGPHCIYLQRDIQSRLTRYGGDKDILAVWIWAELRSDGDYDLFIGYA